MGFFVLVLFWFFSVFGDVLPNRMEQERVFALSIPKSGTHLMAKLLEGILSDHPQFRGFYPTRIEKAPFSRPDLPSTSFFVLSHLYGGFDSYKNACCKKVVLIRDPRDAAVSMVKWIEKDRRWGPWTPSSFINSFLRLPEDKKLEFIICFPDQYLGLHYFCQKALEWMSYSDVFICRFEDIIGVSGGGDAFLQRKTIQDLSRYLGVSLSESKLSSLINNLFGGTYTFRNGQIGEWRSSFSAEDKIIFKSVMGDLLIKLGYESNDDW